MKKLLIIIILGVLFFDLPARNLADLSADEFILSSSFNSPIDLKAVDSYLIELGVLHLSNQYRVEKGRVPLSYNQSLAQAAIMHSEQMQSYRFFAHINKRNSQLSTMDRRATAVGYVNYQSLAENIYYGAIELDDPKTYRELCSTIVNAFIESKGHRVNLLASDINDMGCGIYFEQSIQQGYWYFYFTQDFGKQ